MRYILENKEAFGIIISFLAVIIPLFNYLNAKNKEQKQINFERFHEKIIRKISNLKIDAGLDEQITVIYDLRRFPEYYSVSRRILTDLKEWWMPQLNEKPHFKRLIIEADETIKYIDTNKNFFKRVYTEFRDKYL